MELLETLSSEWAIRALIASSMVGLMCGVIGCFIVLRNMSLIGDALSHAILPGIFVSFIIVGYSTIGFFTGSVVAGLLTALIITWIQQNIDTKNDAAIGIVFTAMFFIGVIGISWISKEKGAHLDLKDFLFGNVLGISTEDIIITAVITVYTLLSVIILFRYLFITTFQPTIAKTMGISVKAIHYFLMLLLSFAVVSALRSVGVILVVAMLITPASTALLLSDQLKKVVIISGVLGLFSAVAGMLLAIVFDTTPGPAMVLFSTAIYFLVAIFAPHKGYLIKHIASAKQRDKIVREDIIKYISKTKGGKERTISEIQEYLKLKSRTLSKHLSFLSKNEFVTLNTEGIKLAFKGKTEANKLVRAHRLWESYQVNKMGISEDKIHDEAEKYEHLLTDDLLDEMDEKLGFPEKDPHGSPIPKKTTLTHNALIDADINKEILISPHQPNQNVESELWELGILPNSKIVVEQILKNHIKIRTGGLSRKISKVLAAAIEINSEL